MALSTWHFQSSQKSGFHHFSNGPFREGLGGCSGPTEMAALQTPPPCAQSVQESPGNNSCHWTFLGAKKKKIFFFKVTQGSRMFIPKAFFSGRLLSGITKVYARDLALEVKVQESHQHTAPQHSQAAVKPRAEPGPAVCSHGPPQAFVGRDGAGPPPAARPEGVSLMRKTREQWCGQSL